MFNKISSYDNSVTKIKQSQKHPTKYCRNEVYKYSRCNIHARVVYNIYIVSRIKPFALSIFFSRNVSTIYDQWQR